MSVSRLLAIYLFNVVLWFIYSCGGLKPFATEPGQLMQRPHKSNRDRLGRTADIFVRKLG
jgi:hypothetical protein